MRTMNMKAEHIQRLMDIDAALAKGGMRRSELAATWGCDKKTIQREHEILREITGDDCEIDDIGRWFYCDRRKRLFRP